MLRYSDFQNQGIAKQKYKYYRIQKPVAIDDDFGGKIPSAVK